MPQEDQITVGPLTFVGRHRPRTCENEIKKFIASDPSRTSLEDVRNGLLTLRPKDMVKTNGREEEGENNIQRLCDLVATALGETRGGRHERLFGRPVASPKRPRRPDSEAGPESISDEEGSGAEEPDVIPRGRSVNDLVMSATGVFSLPRIDFSPDVFLKMFYTELIKATDPNLMTDFAALLQSLEPPALADRAVCHAFEEASEVVARSRADLGVEEYRLALKKNRQESTPTASQDTQPATQPKVVEVHTVTDGVSLGKSKPIVKAAGGYTVHANTGHAQGPLTADSDVINASDPQLAHSLLKARTTAKGESERYGLLTFSLMHHVLAYPLLVKVIEKGSAWVKTDAGREIPQVFRMRFKAMFHSGAQNGSDIGNLATDFASLQEMLESQKDPDIARVMPLHLQVQSHSGVKKILAELVAWWICIHTPSLTYSLKELYYTAFNATDAAAADRFLKGREYAGAELSQLSKLTIRRCQQNGFFPNLPDALRSGSACTGSESATFSEAGPAGPPAGGSTPQPGGSLSPTPRQPGTQPQHLHRQPQKVPDHPWPEKVTIQGKEISIPSRGQIGDFIKAKQPICVYCGQTGHYLGRSEERLKGGCGQGAAIPGYDHRHSTIALWAKLNNKY